MTASNDVRVDVTTGDDLDVRRFAVKQRMSELFRIELEVVSKNLSVDFSEVIGNDATFAITTGLETSRIAGVAIEMEQLRVDKAGLATYRLVLAPRAWLMTQRKNFRIFQFKSELEIVRQLLDEWGVEQTARIHRAHKARKFRVQYDESDFTFMCRLLEDAGIAFCFEPSEDGTALVLDDEPQGREASRPSLPFWDKPQVTGGDFVTRVEVRQAVRPGKVTIGDIDYRRPSTAQPRLSAAAGLSRESRLEQLEHEPGAFLFQGASDGRTPTADDRGASRTDEASGAEKTMNRLLGKRSGEKVVRFESNVVALAPGVIVGISGHPHRVTAGSTLLITGTELAGQHDGTWSVKVESVSTAVPYRPAPVTPKPRMPGLESATVVGPSSEEIHTDEYGRVRVHFHWDRESGRDENSSCWLPTCQPWAGAGFGGLNLPRIGQEVLVEFLGGDPDRPMVMGRVYTLTNPAPDALPRFKTVSGIMSESTPRMVMGAADTPGAASADSPLGGGTPMSAEEINSEVTQPGAFQAASPTSTMHNWQGSGIKFNDDNGQQMVYMQAQRDLNIVVNDCWRTIVGNQRSCKVGTDDQLTVDNFRVTQVVKDQGVRVGGNQKLTVTERRAEQVEGELVLDVGAGGFHIESREERIAYQASKSLVISSKKSIEFFVKGSHVIVEPALITINSGDKVVLQSKEGKGS